LFLGTEENTIEDPLEFSHLFESESVDSDDYNYSDIGDWPPKYYPWKITSDTLDQGKVPWRESKNSQKKAKSTFVSTAVKRAPKREKKIDNDKVKHFIEASPQRAFFYTGLTDEHRKILWDFLGDIKDKLQIYKVRAKSGDIRTISVKSQFLLTLLILRRNRKFTDCALHFNLGKVLVGRVFKTWLQFLYYKFKDLQDIMFIKKAHISKPLPKHFQNPLCREVRVVIDCTEIFIENSNDFDEQGNKFSRYKGHTTAKVLLGVAPSGACSFVSDCYEGRGSFIEKIIIDKFDKFLQFIDKF
jgi:hypothetical protein